eukprot:223077_1
MNKYSSLTFIANIEIINNINNEMEEKEETKIDLINEESNILNAQIISLTSQLEKEQKLKESMAFITDKSPESVSKVQTSFIDYVVQPLWKNAQAIAGELNDRLNVLAQNRENWSNYPHDYQKLRPKNVEN